MRGTRRVFCLLIAGALASLMIVGCAPDQEPNAVVPAKEAVEEKTAQTEQSVDEALNQAQAAVNEYVSFGDGLETRVNGLQVKSNLQEIQRKVTDAINEVGDKKVATLNDLSTKFDSLIYRVELAASKLPSGGKLQTELTDFATKLKATRAELAAAAASYEASGTPSP